MNESIDINPRATRISVRVWRVVAGTTQWLFAYAGALDGAVLGAVMQHVQRLTSAVPGEWTVEIIGADAHGGALHGGQDLGHLRRRGLRPRRTPACLRRDASNALLALALAPSPSLLVH